MKKILFILMGAVLVLQFSCAQAPKKEMETVFYPPLHADKPRIQFLQSINSESDIGKESSEFVKGSCWGSLTLPTRCRKNGVPTSSNSQMSSDIVRR